MTYMRADLGERVMVVAAGHQTLLTLNKRTCCVAFACNLQLQWNMMSTICVCHSENPIYFIHVVKRSLAVS